MAQEQMSDCKMVENKEKTDKVESQQTAIPESKNQKSQTGRFNEVAIAKSWLGSPAGTY